MSQRAVMAVRKTLGAQTQGTMADMFSDSESTGSDVASCETPYRPKFGLSALFWTVGTIGLTLAYLRRFDSPTVYANAIAAVVGACLIGAAVGWRPRRMVDAIYWAVVITIAAYLSVIGDIRSNQTFHFAWAAVGAVTGACCGVISPKRVFRRMLAGCVAAAAVMAVFAQFGSLRDGSFDLFCAPVVGAFVGLQIELVLWVERGSSIARYMTASWLLLAVIAGNLIVPLVLA